MNILDKSFVEKYDPHKVFDNDLGHFVYVRSYSRWLEDKGRREYWTETIERTVNYIYRVEINYRKKNKLPINYEELKKEAEYVYDNMYNLKQFSSGRTMWVGDTEVGNKYGMANYNCSFTVINKFEDFVEMFYLLLLGSGVGFRTLPSDIKQLPNYDYLKTISFKDYEPLNKDERLELTVVEEKGNKVILNIGDSKEGWVEALRYYFDIMTLEKYKHIKEIQFIFDSVRPKGEVLKRFGGHASGHESIKKMFSKIHSIMSEAKGKLKTIDALDIGNIIAENVVSGGVRRSSEINLAAVDDLDIEMAKTNLFKKDELGNWYVDPKLEHRMMSNNSNYYLEKPSRETLHYNMVNLRNTGERGLINVEAALKRREDFEGVNPCVEILLANKGLCNLTTVNVYGFVKNGVLDVEELVKAFKLSAKLGVRMTLIDLELEEWDKIQKRDRLIGASLTGWFDMVDAVNLTKEDQIKLLIKLKQAVHDSANNFADELKINRPLLKTTIKPEGTISQLPGVSSGLHRQHSKYYIRRVRISSTDPLVKVLKELEYPLLPEVNQDPNNPNTWVVEFPIETPARKTKFEITAIEQLETYKMFMENYVDHNASITVSVRDHEWDDVEDWIWNNWDSFIGISFISLDDHVYDLAPYEEISKEEYLRRKENMKTFNPELISKFDKGKDFEVGSDCESGLCPIR